MSNNKGSINKGSHENHSEPNNDSHVPPRGQANPNSQPIPNGNSQTKNASGTNASIPKPKSIGNYILGISICVSFTISQGKQLERELLAKLSWQLIF